MTKRYNKAVFRRKDRMMPRKKKRTIIIVSIILVVVIMAVTLILLYINTDMFKSNSELFTKYIGQNVENMEVFYSEIGKSEYNELLKENQYTAQTQVKINYVENIGTSSENTKNSINHLKLKINEQTDHKNQYHYQDINLLDNNEKVAQIEYIQQKNTYGIKFSDKFSQYVLADNENLKELFEKAGYTEETLANIPDKIEFNKDFESIFQFSEEEKQNRRTRYISIIKDNVSKSNFSKQKNQIIQIDGKNIKANAYILTLTKEQLNHICIKILEEVKQDESILIKIDKLQALLEKYQQNSQLIKMREKFIKKIEDWISKITKNNIGQEEAKVIVYESNGRTVSTSVQNPDYEIYIDLLCCQSEEYYIQMSYKDIISEKEKLFTLKKKKEETKISLKDTKSGNITEYNVIANQKIEGNNGVKNIVAKYEDETNRVEATIEQEINIVNSFENEVILTDENSINLSKLQEEQVKAVLDRVKKGVSEEIKEVTASVIKIEEFEEILKAMGVIKEQQAIQVTGVTETERNRFNSQFEILQGENLENTEILKIMDAIKENIIDMEVVSNRELKLKLDRLDKNEETVTTLKSFIEERKNRRYNVKVEYDETTGLVSDIILTMLEK